MSKLLVIFGITGQQGSSIANIVLNDLELSKTYRIRGVTRDASKSNAQALSSKGIEIVRGEVDDAESVKNALQGAHTVYAMTVSIYQPGGKEAEIAQGKALADAAVAANVQYYIWSTVPYSSKISGGKYPVPLFDSKGEVAEYIKTLPIKSAFYCPGSFMQNLSTFQAPRPVGNGTFAITNFVGPQTQWPLVEIAEDTGKYVAAILAEPDKYQGKTLSAATKLYTYQQIVETMSKVLGKKVVYNQVPESVFRGFLPEGAADGTVAMYSYIEKCGYYGSDTGDVVAWTSAQARGKLTTLEEYLEKNPPNL